MKSFRQDAAVPGSISGVALGSVFLASLLGPLAASVLTAGFTRITKVVFPGLTKLDEVVIPYDGIDNVHKFGDYDDYEEYGDYGAENKLRKLLSQMLQE